MTGALALDSLRQRREIDRLLLDAASILVQLAAGGKSDLDETGRKRAGEMAQAVRRMV